MQNTVLPDPDSDGDGAAVPGRELHPTLPRSVFDALTSLGRAAAARFNELGRNARVRRPQSRLGADCLNRCPYAHHLPLEDAPRGYEIFRDKAEGCLTVVLQP